MAKTYGTFRIPPVPAPARCHDCEQSTSGRCVQHGTTTVVYGKPAPAPAAECPTCHYVHRPVVPPAYESCLIAMNAEVAALKAENAKLQTIAQMVGVERDTAEDRAERAEKALVTIGARLGVGGIGEKDRRFLAETARAALARSAGNGEAGVGYITPKSRDRPVVKSESNTPPEPYGARCPWCHELMPCPDGCTERPKRKRAKKEAGK